MNTGYLYEPKFKADGLANPSVSTRVILHIRRVRVSEMERRNGYEANIGEETPH